MINTLVVTGVQATTVASKPPVGEKVPLVVYNGAGTCSGAIYLEDGTPLTFTAPINVEEARELTGLLLRVASRVYSELKGGMPSTEK